MITRMEITYRSKLPCERNPEIFTTGSYTVKADGHEITFDFTEMIASTEIQDGYLYVLALQKNFDENVLGDFGVEELGESPVKYTIPMIDAALRKAKKEDFTEIFYECFGDQQETDFIRLEPLDITFYDYSTTGDGKGIAVEGLAFSNLEQETALTFQEEQLFLESNVFWSPFEEQKQYNGRRFKVLAELDDSERDSEVGRIFAIQLDGELMLQAYIDEINGEYYRLYAQ